MAHRNQTNNQNNEEKSSSGSWLFAGVVGAAIGAGLTYILSKSDTENCNRQRHPQTNRGNNYQAPANGTCTICMEDYDATVTLPCGHTLHRGCYVRMQNLVRGPKKCPVCRSEFP